MTKTGVDPADPLTDDELAATVAAVRPDWELVDAEPIYPGSDVLYRVTVAGDDSRRREAVLKRFRDAEPLSFRTHERFLVEPDLLALVGAETDLPVPDVYGVSRSGDACSVPAFLMEAMPGEHATAVAFDADTPAADRLLHEAGRALARVHEVRSFEAFGDLVADPNESSDDRAAGDATPVPVVRDGRDAWDARLRDIVEGALDRLDGTQFADLAPEMRRYVEDRLAELDLAAESALLHGDFRPGNSLVDRETGALTAVLDWGAAQAGDPRYELAWVVREFAQQAPPGSAVRERVRSTIYEAYGDEQGERFERDAAFERRQRFYLAVTWIAECGWFDAWLAGADESAREARAAQLRARIDSLP